MDFIIFSILKVAYYSFHSVYFFYYQFLYLSIILGTNLILWKLYKKNNDFYDNSQVFFFILSVIGICIYIWNQTTGIFTLFQIIFIIFLSLKIIEKNIIIKILIFFLSFTITITGTSIILVNRIIKENEPPGSYCQTTQLYYYTSSARYPDGEHIICYNEKNEIVSDEIYD